MASKSRGADGIAFDAPGIVGWDVRKIGLSEEELFAPDYDVEVDPALAWATADRIDPATADLLGRCGADGDMPPETDPGLVRAMRLHGLVEIFVPSLTPLGLAARERLQNKEPAP
jgi:hypothetical protein